MRTEVTDEGGLVVAVVEGRLDAATAAAFDEAVQGLPRLTPPRRVLMDLAGLEFISSAGLRSLLTLAKACKAAGARLAFCSLSVMVADVFQISGLMTVFETHPDRGAALRALGGAPSS